MSTLVIPLDAGNVAEPERRQQRVKVAVQQGDRVHSEVVSLAEGRAEVKLEVDPGQPVAVAVGPESAADQEIFRLQTITATVSPRQWTAGERLTLAPITVTAAWWSRWLLWCREFVITGHLRCADGNPVPGAEVRAYDVDYFWWWSSISQVGPAAVTDPSGHFVIKFRWCCGWWPWWWWQLREWTLEPLLVERIQPVLELNPALRALRPSPVPALDLVALNPQPEPPGAPRSTQPALAAGGRIKHPAVLPALRERLTAALPRVPELERLRLWPWWPWTPWFECAPHLIFRATQRCSDGKARVVLAETVLETRWEVPSRLEVGLVADGTACCVPPTRAEPKGDCFAFDGVCGLDPIPTSIGRSGATAGYYSPGGRDRPFAEDVLLSGLFGSSAQADYYEIEHAPHGSGAWSPLPAAAVLEIERSYFDATLPWPTQFKSVPFPVTTVGSHHLYESRHHYEQVHAATWGNALSGRAWYANVDLIAKIHTSGTLADAAHDFRVVGYTALPNGDPDLATGKVMDGCGGPEGNLVVVRLDNRVPSSPQPVPGTVHLPTDEPDCGIVAVRLGGAKVEACGAHQLEPGTALEIDFSATDPDGHLDHYELVVKYDIGSIKNLLSAGDIGSFSLVTLAGDQPGPDYANAVTAATRPSWVGGTFRLHIDEASRVFPKTCCYLVELNVYKRNIVGCYGGLAYSNQTHYSFTVTV